MTLRYEKLSPGLLAAYSSFERSGVAGLREHAESLGVRAEEGTAKPARTIVFLHVDPDDALEGLDVEGCQVNRGQGRVRTAFLPMTSLEALSEDDRIHRIGPSRPYELRMDVAPGRVNVPDFADRTRLTGRDVVVGVIDSGLQTTHPAFAGRVLSLWDQTIDGPGVAEGRYGIELVGQQLSASRDTNGHGTHVAGIAAGGLDPYRGVAPEADLVIVKTSMENAHIADAVRYVFRMAAERGKPAVANLSLGAHWDAHDGTDDLSLVLEDESGPGRIVCAAAGNEGNDSIHARVNVANGESREIRFVLPVASPFGQTRIALNAWYSGLDRVEVSIVSPGGAATPFQLPNDHAGNPSRRYDLPQGVVVHVVAGGPDPQNGDRQVYVEVHAPGSASGGTWRLRVRGHSVRAGFVDVWAPGRNHATFIGPEAVDAMKIGSPGSASSAITVGSFTTRVDWTDELGRTQQVGLALDDVSDFSSEGPLRNGDEKPDLVAPGAMIVSARSADAPVPESSRVSTEWRVTAGTSMATPFVAGLVALLLEEDSSIDAAQARSRLLAACSIPGGSGFDPKWGRGVIDGSKL